MMKISRTEGSVAFHEGRKGPAVHRTPELGRGFHSKGNAESGKNFKQQVVKQIVSKILGVFRKSS